MSQTAFKQLKNNAKTSAALNALNNTTASLTFSVASTGGSHFPATASGQFWVTAYNKLRYADAGDDPNMRIGLVTARNVDSFTVTWGQFGTPINAIPGSPAIELFVIDQHFKDIHTAINAAEANIDSGVTNLAAETAARIAGDSSEATTRSIADTTLQNNINAEAAARAATDATLQPLDSDLTAVAGLSTTGLISRTATGAMATRTIGAGSSKVTIANGDGVAGNPSVDVVPNNVLAGSSTSSLPEGSNLYYTDVRADARITLQKAAANGLATLGSDSKIPTAQLPNLAISDTFVVASQAAMLALTAQRGDTAKRTDSGQVYILATDDPTQLANWVLLSTDFTANVDSVNGRIGAVVGLAEDNTVVHNTGTETIAGVKTFSSSPVVPTPSTATAAANKSYADALAAVAAQMRTADATVGTGNSDYVVTGTSDQTIINNAINAVNAAGGGTVWLRGITFNLSGPVVLRSGVSLIGDGKASILRLANATNTAVITAINTSLANVKVEGLIVDGNAANQTSNGSNGNATVSISGNGSTVYDNLIIHHNIIKNSYQHALFIGGDNTSMKLKVVRENTIINHGAGTVGFGIYTDYAPATLIQGNTIEQSNGSDAIEMGHLGGIRCIGNDLKDGPIQFPFASNSIIANNIVRANVIQNDANAADNMIIIGNQVLNATPATAYAGITVYGAGAIIGNNYVKVTAQSGIRVYNGSNATISHNTVDGVDPATGGSNGIYAEVSSNVYVFGNQVKNFARAITFVLDNCIAGYNVVTNCTTGIYLSDSTSSGHVMVGTQLILNNLAGATTAFNPNNQTGYVISHPATNGIVFGDTTDLGGVLMARQPISGSSKDALVVEQVGTGAAIRVKNGANTAMSVSKIGDVSLGINGFITLTGSQGSAALTTSLSVANQLSLTHTGATGTGLTLSRSGNSGSLITGASITATNAGAGGAVALALSGATTGLQDKGSQLFNAKAYGAKGDVKTVVDGAITSGAAALTSATAAFTAADVGKYLTIVGAGAAGALLATTISAYVSATQVTLAANAGTTVTGATTVFGTDDTTAINAATAAALAAGGGQVVLTHGNYASVLPLNTATGVGLVGEAYGSVTITKLGSQTGGNGCIIRTAIGTGSTYQDGVQVENLVIDGTYGGASGNGVHLQGVNGLTVRNVKVINPAAFGFDIGSNGGGEPYAERIRFENVFVTASNSTDASDGIGGGGIRNSSFRGITVYKNNRAGTGIDITNMDRVNFSDISIEFVSPVTTNWGISSDFGATNVKLQRVHVKNAGQYGIYFGASSGHPITDFKIDNCTVDTCQVHGIYVQGISAAHSVDVKIINSTVRGWSTPTAGQGIKVEYADGFVVIGNTISTPGTGGQYPMNLANCTNGQAKHNTLIGTTLQILNSSSTGVDISLNNYATTPGTQSDAISVLDGVVTLPVNPLGVAQGGTGVRTLTGLVKGNGASAMTAAVAGTDYAAATTGSVALKGDGAGGFGAATLNDVGAASADYSLNSHKITNLLDPTSGQDAATKAYVDAAAAGIDWKRSVRAATTANGTLASAYANGSVVDGVTLATGDRILLKNQTTGSENGIYTVNASGAPTRATDADANVEITAGMAVFVEEGTTNADTGWLMTNDGAVTVGTTALTFVQFTSLGQITAGNGLSKSGSTLTIDTSITVDKNTAQTLTNKTLTSPAISTPTGIVKGDVGLGNVDNTSDATKNAATATLTNKTLTAPVIATIVNTGTLTLPTSTDTLVGRATTDTLTNKTLTAPVISSIVNTGTLTLPTSTDTLVGRATTDTLTNKTLTTPTIGDFTNANHNHSNAAGGGTIAHSALTGLTSGDDHTQYGLLAGRSGGQVLKGGTGASENLRLQSTNSATKGFIYFSSSSAMAFDETNGRLGIGTVTPQQVFTLGANARFSTEMLRPPSPAATPSASGGTLADATYYYVIQASDGLGYTIPSTEVSAVVSGGGGAGSVALTWTAVQGATLYKILRGTSTGAQTVFYTSATNSFTDTGAANTGGTPATSTSAYGVNLNPNGDSWMIGGKLGLGTSAPNNLLELRSTSYPQLRLAYNSGTFATLGVTVNGYTVLGNSSLGIGEATPGSKLAVFGGLSVGADTAYSQVAAPTSGAIIKGIVGIGMANPSAKLDVTGNFRTVPGALTDAATIATDASTSNYFRVTLAGNRTLGNPTNMQDGQRCTWELIQDATGSRTITLDTNFVAGPYTITLTTTASKRDFLEAIYNSTAAKWYVVAFNKGY